MDITRLIKSIGYSIILSLFDCGRMLKRDLFNNTLIIILIGAIYSFLSFHIFTGILFIILFIVFEHIPNLIDDIPKVVNSPTQMSQIIRDKMEFKPFSLDVSNGTGVDQTIFVGGRFGIKEEFKREEVDSVDGGMFAMDWLHGNELTDESPIILVYHGLAGGSRESYVERFCHFALQAKYRTVVVTCRGSAGTRIKTPRAFNSTSVDDSITAIKHAHELYPKAQLMGIGYSLGGMILSQVNGRLTTEFLRDNNYIGTLTISPTWNSLIISDVISSSFMGNFYRSLAHIIDKNYDFLKECNDNGQINIDLEVLKKRACKKNILAFDRFFNSKIFKYGDPMIYYYDIETWHTNLPKCKIPYMSLNSFDDPIARFSFGTEQRIKNVVGSGKNLMSVFTKTGGHLGWVSSKRKTIGWDDKLALQYFGVLLDLQKSGLYDKLLNELE